MIRTSPLSANPRGLEPLLAQYWWVLFARGALAIVFGLTTLVWPSPSFAVLLLFVASWFFADGVVVHPGTPDPKGAVGKVFMQPRVADAAGAVKRFDDAIGPRFALLSWSARADAWIDDEARRILDTLGALPVVVRPDCQALDREPPAGGIVLADIEGAFKRWFDVAGHYSRADFLWPGGAGQPR